MDFLRIGGVEVRASRDSHWVRVRSKSESRLMRFLGVVLGWFGVPFMTRFWTTIGSRTIWVPVGLDPQDIPDSPELQTVLQHELVHVEQAKRWPLFWQLSYMLLLPAGLAYFRWRWEREAYLVDLRAGTKDVERVVELLWGSYFWTWPKPWMRKWFHARLRDQGPDLG